MRSENAIHFRSGEIAAARSRSLSAISREMVLLYWELGRHIVEFGGQAAGEMGSVGFASGERLLS